MTHHSEPAEAVARIVKLIQQYDTPKMDDHRRRYTPAQLEMAVKLALSTTPAPSASGGLEAVLAAYEAETRALPLGAACREKGDSAYNWRMSVVKDLRKLAARLASPAATSAETQGGDGVREALAEELRQFVGNYWRIKTAAATNPFFMHEHHARLIERSIAALASPAASRGEPVAIPAGWKLVPLTPTLDMQRAYFDEVDRNMTRVENDYTFGRFDNNRLAYRAMLIAAPPPPAPVESAQVKELKAEVARVKSDREYVIGFNDGWDEAIKQNLRFPTMLRKMWAGQEVQKWIDDEMTRIRASLDLATDAKG